MQERTDLKMCDSSDCMRAVGGFWDYQDEVKVKLEVRYHAPVGRDVSWFVDP